MRRWYRRDPNYELVCSATPPAGAELPTLQTVSVAPAGIADPEYRRLMFERPGFGSKVSLISSWAAQTCYFNLYFSAAQAPVERVQGPERTLMLGWNRLYNFNLPEDYARKMSAQVDIRRHAGTSMLSWVRGKDGGRTLKIDAKQMRIETEAEVIQADVINVIPPMKAGQVVSVAGSTPNQSR